MAKKNFTAAVSEILAGEATVDQAVADVTAPETETAPEVTVLEPGLAKGLTPHETEQALHAMGKEASPVAAAAAAKTGKQGKVGGGWFPHKSKATHSGKTLTVVEGKARKSGGGVAGLEYIRSNPGVTFEDWAAQGFDIIHLNWDINRGWVILGDANDDGLGDLRKAIAAAKSAYEAVGLLTFAGQNEVYDSLYASWELLVDELVTAEAAQAQQNAEAAE